MWSTSCGLTCDTSTVIMIMTADIEFNLLYSAVPIDTSRNREKRKTSKHYGYSSIHYVLLVLICRLEIDQQKQLFQSTNAVSFTMRPVDVQLGMLCCVGRLNGFLCVFISPGVLVFSLFLGCTFSIPLLHLFAHSTTAKLWGNAQRKLQLRCTSVTRDMETVIGRHNRSD